MNHPTEPAWREPPLQLTLPGDAIHIWRVRLDQPITVINQLRQHLSGDELARAKRFHFDRDRRKFIAARGALRSILSRYLAQPPATLRFTYSPHGKPALDPAISPDPLAFNLSHSGELALVAVTQGRAVGIDLEQIRPMPDAKQIAQRFFAKGENEVFQTIPPAQRDEAFFNCWTRKEAFIKAIGEGLSHPLDSFEVSLRPGEPATLLEVRGKGAAEEQNWSLWAFRPGAEYVAALAARAARAAEWQLSFWVA